MYQNPVLMLMYKTVQVNIEFTFKMKTLCTYTRTEDTAGGENAGYIYNERHCVPVREQKGLEYVIKIESDMKTTDLFNTYF